jgi:hypothetical protein
MFSIESAPIRPIGSTNCCPTDGRRFAKPEPPQRTEHLTTPGPSPTQIDSGLLCAPCARVVRAPHQPPVIADAEL